MKVSAEAKEEMKGKLNSIKDDIKEAGIKKSIDGVKFTDGKVTADFCIEGLPKKEKKEKGLAHPESDYKRYPKIFDTVKEFTTYAEKFFDEDFNED